MVLCGTRRAWRAAGIVLGLAVAALLLGLSPDVGVLTAANKDSDEEGKGEVFSPLDYSRRSKLVLAERLIADERHDETAKLLGGILAEPQVEDYFLDATGSGSYKRRVAELLESLPPKGREAYELWFGAEARRQLRVATESGEIEPLSNVVRRFFLTQAGARAALLLARHDLDSGRPLAAATLLTRLARSWPRGSFDPVLPLMLATAWREAGQPDEARTVLDAWRQRTPGGQLFVAGKPVPTPAASEDSLTWFAGALGPSTQRAAPPPQDWAVIRGDAARNGAGSGNEFLTRRRWQAPAFQDAAEQQAMARALSTRTAQSRPPIPALHVLAVASKEESGRRRDVVVCRSVRHLMAVDFATGKMLWRAKTGEAEEVAAENNDDDAFARLARSEWEQKPDSATAALEQRMWEDALYGAISSDGEFVYSVEDLAFISGNVSYAAFGGTRARGNEELTTNRLFARSLAGGGTKWEVGGPDSRAEPELARAFFLGAPLPLEGSLYAIAEVKRELRLVVLDAATGKLRWQQQLLPMRRPVLMDPLRRKMGASPSYADGLLVCPTTAGAVVAVDLTTRSLAWGHHYKPQSETAIAPWGSPFSDDTDTQRPHWLDATVTLADGRVIITPAELDEIVCLNLRDGRRAPGWQLRVARKNGLYVACVHRGVLVLVGPGEIQGLKLSDGSKAFAIERLAADGETGRTVPSGRGFLSGNHYYLPVTSGEILRIDLEAGRIATRIAASPPRVLGNLIAYQGDVLSLGVEGLEAFHQLDPLRERIDRALAANPRDPWALARLGELKWAAGNHTEAIESLRQSRTLDPDTRTHSHTSQLLASVLLDELDRDFPANQNLVPEVESLVELAEDRARFERTTAVGLQRSGAALKALDRYLRMYDHDEDPYEFQRLDDRRLVRRDRWIQARLAELWQSAAPDDRTKIDGAIATRWEAVGKLDSVKSLRRFLNHFDGHALAEPARQRLAERLIESGELLAAEQALLRLVRSTDRARAGAATAALVKLLVRAERPQQALQMAEHLGEQFADVVCDNGKTGRQLADQLLGEALATAAAARNAAWPGGWVKTELGKRQTVQRSRMAFALAHRGPRGPVFAETAFTIDRDQNRIIARDGLGRQQFDVLLAETTNRFLSSREVLSCYARTSGHVMFVSSGTQLYVVDALRASGQPAERVLWAKTLSEFAATENPFLSRTNRGDPRRTQRTMPWGEVQYQALGLGAKPIGTIGPVTQGGVCFQQERDLVAADPLTGTSLWTYRNLPEGCDVWADDEYVLATPTGSQEALVFRAVDGEPLGKRAVPSELQRMTTLGRRVLVWGDHEGELQIGLLDPWTGKREWTRSIEPSSRAQLLADDAVAVLQPSGKFVVWAITDGRTLAEDQLLPEIDAFGASQIVALHVVVSPDRYFVMANRRKSPDKTSDDKFAWIGNHAPIVTGRLYAINRSTGKSEWPVPAEIEFHGLVMNQPSRLPVLVFARQTTGGRDSSRDLQLMSIDKRTGSVVSRIELPKTLAYDIHLTADPTQKLVKLAIPSRTIVLRWTGVPLPPEPPVQSGDKETGTGSGFLQAVIGSIFGAGDSDSSGEEMFSEEDEQ